MTTFSSFPMREELHLAIADLGYETPTPIQEKVIPLLLESPVDIIGLAQTGTGKTAAFGLPLLNYIDVNKPQVQCLVLSPTRELCMQILEEFKKYGKHLNGFRTTAVYGGVPIGGQIREVKNNPQIIVATPGRLIDLLERKALFLDEVQYVVLDEADEMLNMGFREDIDFILQNTPERQHTWLFSATMSNEVRGIAKRFMQGWKEISVAPPNVTNENIDHQYYVTRNHLRFETLQRLLDFNPGIYGIIFVRTKQDCQDVAEKLMRQGYHVSPLHGDMDQKMRSKVMERFKSKQLQAIVATDVAARGIDVNDISHVINYELPEDPEIYTHRSGRTARAGKSGICMSIVNPREISSIRTIERLVKNTFHKSDIPDGAEVVRKRLFFFMEQIANAEPEANFGKLYQQAIAERFKDLEHDEIVRRLLWVQLKDTMDVYQNAEDLNAGFEAPRERNSDGGGKHEKADKNSTRLFINLGTKDGLTNEKLLDFITSSTDLDASVIERITVRDLASFFNVKNDVAEFLISSLSDKKFKSRKVRLEEADKSEKPRGDRGNRSENRSEQRGERSYGGGGDRDRSSQKRFSGDVRRGGSKPGSSRVND